MVNGLNKFRDHFGSYADRYVLIGGTACDVAMTEAGVEFRLTKDLDIVLVVEAIDAEFVRAFWKFVSAGGYEAQEKSTGERQFYRFKKPTDETFPSMLELFSRRPDVLQQTGESHLTPLPIEDEVSSLSAILMDNDYYDFILAGRREMEGLSTLDAVHLLPLKARAWIDLTQREKDGQKIKSNDIKKHKYDVFRLFQIIDPEVDPEATMPIKADLRKFIKLMKIEVVDLGSVGITTLTRDQILEKLSVIYRLT